MNANGKRGEWASSWKIFMDSRTNTGDKILNKVCNLVEGLGMNLGVFLLMWWCDVLLKIFVSVSVVYVSE